MQRKKQTISESFFNAFRGIKHELRERNFIILIFCAGIAIALSLALDLARDEKIIILILIGFVLAAEIMNSACERILNLLVTEQHPEVARIKDMLAGSVLIYSGLAFIIGCWIFGNALFK